MRNLLTRLICVSITAVPGGASATVLLMGGNHTISGQVNDNVVLDGYEAPTTLNVASGGVTQGVTMQGRSQLNVTGNGRVGPVWLGSVGNAAFSGNSYIAGNITSNDASPGQSSEANALRRVVFQDHATLAGDFNAAGNVRVQDQAVILGNVIGGPNSLALTMTGGAIAGQVSGSSSNDHYVTMSGGAILGGLTHVRSFTHLDISGGYIGGQGINTAGAVYADISGGQIDGGISHLNEYNGSYISITGGVINADPGDYLISLTSNNSPFGSGSRLDLWGGQLGYREAGLGIWLDASTEFNIYGWDLSFTDGLLSGYLSDGNWFSSAVNFGSNWNGQVRLNDVSVPEPGSASLMLIGLAVMFRRRILRTSMRAA